MELAIKKKGSLPGRPIRNKYYDVVLKMDILDSVEIPRSDKEQQLFYQAIYLVRQKRNVIFKSRLNKETRKRTFLRVA